MLRMPRSNVSCGFVHLFDIIHFFFLLRKKMPMTNIPSNPRNTGKVLASEFSISKTAAITIKMIPTNSAIFWNTMLLILINPRNCISFLLNAYLYAIIGANCEKTGLTFTIHTLKWHKILR